MDSNRVYLELSRRRHHPGVRVASTVGAPEAFSCPGKNQATHRRVLHDCSSPARLGRNSLNFAPTLTSRLAFVDPATSGSNDVVGIARINIDGKDVRVINYAILDGPPGLSSVN